MPHVEPVEPRWLFAALTPDPSFAGGRGVVLPDGTDRGVLATHGAVYVEGVSDRGVFRVYKYTDAGTLDTTWGDGGSVRPAITRGVRDLDYTFSNPPDLVYDARTRALIVATDNGHTVAIERFDAQGHADTGWATGGVAEFTDKRATFSVGRIVPAAGKKLVVAVTRLDVADNTDDLMLARINRTGHVDKSFDQGRFATVMAGHAGPTPVQENGVTTRVNSSVPLFGDLRITAAGYRVVGFRQRTIGTVDYAQVNADGDLYYTTRTNLSVESTAVSTGGGVATSAVTPLAHDRVNEALETATQNDPVLALADGDDGVVTLVRRDTVSPISFGSPAAATVTRIDAGAVTSSKALGAKVISVDAHTVFRDAAGRVYVNLYGAFARYTATLTLDTSFGDGGRADTAGGSGTPAADDAGRIVVVRSGKGGTLLTRLV